MSWLKYPIAVPRSIAIWPASGSSSRVIKRKIVVLPAPLGPTRPIFSPRFTAAEASRNRICAPWRLETASMRITAILRAGVRTAGSAAVPTRRAQLRARAASPRVGETIRRSNYLIYLRFLLLPALGVPHHAAVRASLGRAVSEAVWRPALSPAHEGSLMRSASRFAGVALGLLVAVPAAAVPTAVTTIDLPTCDVLSSPASMEELGL